MGLWEDSAREQNPLLFYIMLDKLFDMMYMSLTRYMHVRQSVCVYDTSYVCIIGRTYVR